MGESITLLIESFNGLTKIKSTPIPFPIRQLCSLHTVIYVYSAPLALATAFRGFTEYWNIMGRTVGGSVLLACAFFGINQTAVDLEDPLGNDSNDLPLDRMGQALHKHIYRESGCESAEPESPTHAVRRCVSVWYREGTPIAQVCDAVPCCVELCIPCACSLKRAQASKTITVKK